MKEFSALLIGIVAAVLIYGLLQGIGFWFYDCTSNVDCELSHYCSVEHTCVEHPTAPITIVKKDYSIAGVFIAVGIIISALILRWKHKVV